MADYDNKIAEARAMIKRHEEKIHEIAEAMTKYSMSLEHEMEHEKGAVDFRPTLKAYAQSSDLESQLLESKTLYEDLLPTMIHVVMEHHNGAEEYDYYLEKEEWGECQKSDRRWVEVISEQFNWDFVTYTHKDFRQVASEKKEEEGAEEKK
jgi:hypothetical protein